MPDPTPSEQRFEQVLATRSAVVADLARKVRALVRETLPDAIEVPNHGQDGVGFGVNQYGHDGWGVGVIGVAKNWVTLGLMRGATLPDPLRIVEGTGRSVRHVKIRSAQEFSDRRDALVSLLRAATGVPVPPVVQGALDLGVIDEPTRHSALSAERSQSARRAADARAASAALIQAPMPEPAAKKPAAKKPAAKKPATNKPAAKKPAAKKPAAKKPATNKPAAKKPAAKKPAAKKPAAKKPAAKKPAAKKPAAKKPAAKKPAAKKPATKKPATKKPARR